MRSGALAVAILSAIGMSALFAISFVDRGEASADSVSELETIKAEYRRPSTISLPEEKAAFSKRAALGKSLFFDPRLSKAGDLSCASCHNPSLAWSDGLPTAIGHMGRKAERRTPGIENLAWGGPYFWDGRAASLEDQARGPMQAEGEMNTPLTHVVDTVSSIPGYRASFAAAFPNAPITIDLIVTAIADFERTIVSGKAPFDAWIEGDEKAINASARRGFALFNGKGRCATCHSGWRLTDDGFHDVGVDSDDQGRGKLMPQNPIVAYAFKTPSLRNVALRAPYMHDGSLKTLRDVIDFYDGGFVRRESLSSDMETLNLDESEKLDLLAFLESLTSKNVPFTLPVLPPRGGAKESE
jgi:cytochrome c peroxidase